MEYINDYKDVDSTLRSPNGRWCMEFFTKWRSLILEKTGLDLDLNAGEFTRVDIQAAAHMTALLVAKDIGYKGPIVSNLTAIKYRLST